MHVEAIDIQYTNIFAIGHRTGHLYHTVLTLNHHEDRGGATLGHHIGLGAEFIALDIGFIDGNLWCRQLVIIVIAAARRKTQGKHTHESHHQAHIDIFFHNRFQLNF